MHWDCKVELRDRGCPAFSQGPRQVAAGGVQRVVRFLEAKSMTTKFEL